MSRERFVVHREVEGTRKRRHDIGDSLARQHGVWKVSARCGEEVSTTSATRRDERVTCDGCKTASHPGS